MSTETKPSVVTFETLVVALKNATKECIKARGTKASKAKVVAAIDAMAAFAAAEYV